MRLRIAIVSQAYHPAVGGVTEHVDASARALGERGHDVAVVTARFPGYRENGVPYRVIRLGRNVGIPFNGAENNITIGLGLRARMKTILDAERFDVVHVHCPISPMLPLATLRAAKQPVVGTFHSSLFSDLAFRAARPALLPFYRRIDRVLAVSEVARACVLRHFPGPVEVVPNGVNLERFRPGLPRLERFDDGVPTILFVGRHDPRKGLPELMAAAAGLAAESVPFRLVIVGDGPVRRRAERLARKGRLEPRVHFEGCVSNDHLPRYYASADVFCSPARGGESFGIVLLEAMAAGVPIVATDLPGYRTVLEPGVQGIVVPPRDPAALRDALRSMLADPRGRQEMGRRGIETARRYAWPDIAARLEAVYCGVLGLPLRARDATPAEGAPRFEAAGV